MMCLLSFDSPEDHPKHRCPMLWILSLQQLFVSLGVVLSLSLSCLLFFLTRRHCNMSGFPVLFTVN